MIKNKTTKTQKTGNKTRFFIIKKPHNFLNISRVTDTVFYNIFI